MVFLNKKIRLILLYSVIVLFAACSGTKEVHTTVIPFGSTRLETNLRLSIANIFIHLKNGKRRRCSAFPYKYENGAYLFITAAHCVSNPDKKKKAVIIDAEHINLYLKLHPFLSDEPFEAEIITAGYKPARDDFAILKVKIPHRIPILPISTVEAKKGDCIINASFPSKADGNIFYATVTKVEKDSYDFLFKLDRMKEAGGMSGSVVVSCETGAILGVAVAEYTNIHEGIVINISRFQDFEEKIKNGDYKYRILGL